MIFTPGQKINWDDVAGAVEYRTKAVLNGGGPGGATLGEFVGAPSEVQFAQLCGAIADDTICDIYIWARNAGGVESDVPAALLNVQIDQSPSTPTNVVIE